MPIYTCYRNCLSTALWYLREIDSTGELVFGGKAVSCCSRHLTRAMNEVTESVRSIRVRIDKVNRLR